MANHLPGILPNDSSQVYLQRDRLQVWSPELEYESQRLAIASPNHDPQASSANPHLGELWAAGPGQAAMLSEDGDTWRLSWPSRCSSKPMARSIG